MAAGSCYIKINNSLQQPSNFGPCYDFNATNAFVPCCQTGDTCLSNGFCQSTNIPANGSGVYTGGCTDSSLQDPSCTAFCAALPNSDIVYSNNYWHCCGQDGNRPNCNNPQGPSFAGQSPFQLTKIAAIEGSPPTAHSMFPTGVVAFAAGVSLAAVGTAVPTDTADQIVTQTVLPSTQAPFHVPQSTTSPTSLISPASAAVSSTQAANSNSASSGMSTGTIVEMAIGIASMIALVTAVLWFICISRKRSRRKSVSGVESPFFPQLGSDVSSSCTNHTGSARSFHPPMSPLSRPDPVFTATPRGQYDRRALDLQHCNRDRSRSALQAQTHGLYSPYLECHELDGGFSPTEMMSNAQREDRMAGGGPDRQLPSLPTSPQTKLGTGQRNTVQSDSGRYQALLRT